MKTDLIIIGTGPGGYKTAVCAAKAGLQVTIIEENKLGGTCLNEGCIPTKCLCHNAEVIESIRVAARYGVSTGSMTFDIAQAMARKEEVVSKLNGGVEKLLQTPGITLVIGKARFAGDAHTIEVNGETYTAPNIIIATGSTTKFLPIEGAHSHNVLTSREMLQLNHIPKRIAVIGGGVIGLEFASIFNSFGSEVTIVEYCKEILPAFGHDIAKRLRTTLKKRGIAFHVGAVVTAIRDNEDGTSTVVFESKGKQQDIQAECVLMAVGRAANTGSLNLDDVGIAYTKQGITVDGNMRTNVEGIYAVGDVNGVCQLAHAATFQGMRALNQILGRTDDLRLNLVPAAVFTTPEVAMVGLTEEACEAQGLEYKVHKAFYRSNGKALSMDAEDGIVNIITANDGSVLGAHVLGAHAADLIHEVALLMNIDGTLEQIASTIHAHPSLSELILSAAES